MPVYMVTLKGEMASIDDIVLFSNYSAMEQYVLRIAQRRHLDGYDADWCYVIMYDGIHQLEKVFVYWCSVDGRILHRTEI